MTNYLVLSQKIKNIWGIGQGFQLPSEGVHLPLRGGGRLHDFWRAVPENGTEGAILEKIAGSR